MLIDTHCHLNFKVFRSRVDEVITRAQAVGVERMIVVGSHLKNSRLATRQADAHKEIWAAVGIHPHHVWDYLVKAKAQSKMTGESLDEILDHILEQIRTEMMELVTQEKVVAVGEIGLDRHFYEETQYENKQITDEYMYWQRAFLKLQLEVAGSATAADGSAGKAVIIHQREAVEDLLEFFQSEPQLLNPKKITFHCCEPDQRLLDFAKQHQIWIGVDGDVTYDSAKAKFIKAVPLDMLLLETDSPYITPEPDRSEFKSKRKELRYKDRVCEPRHVAVIAGRVAELKGVELDEVAQQTTKNAKQCFLVE